MKKFKQFINEEISIRGNKGIPAEKLRDIDRKGSDKVRGLNPMRLMQEIDPLMRRSSNFVRGHEEELTDLAITTVREIFGMILSNVDINAYIVNPREIEPFMNREDAERKEDEQNQPNEEEKKEEKKPQKLSFANLFPKPKKRLDPDLVKSAVDKRKIVNNIIQGEAKNTKHILHLDSVKEGLRKIYGDRWREIFEIWDNISKIADKLDWVIPIEHRADMMEKAPQGMAGAVSVRFPNKEEDKPETNDSNIDDDDSGCSGGDCAYGEFPEEITKPTIRVMAADFPMLLHEIVKGIFELISDPSMPISKELAEEANKQTSSYLDEAEDWKYGPYLAEDLNTFIIKNRKISKYPNIKEFVYGKLIDSSRWSDDECLKNLKNIFLESPEGRKIIDDLIDETISELDDYNTQLSDWEQSKKDSEEAIKYGYSADEPEESKGPVADDKEEWEKPKEKDYSEMSQKELQSIIDDALDEGDYEKVKLVSKYIKEGKEIYLRELSRINENHSRKNK